MTRWLDNRCCKICGRQARLYGDRNPTNGLEGWCCCCQLHYVQNGQDWILRCLSGFKKPGSSSVELSLSSLHLRKHMVILLVGCLLFSSLHLRTHMVILLVGSLRNMERRAQREIWRKVFLGSHLGPVYSDGSVPQSDSDPDSEDDTQSRAYRDFRCPLWKLVLARCKSSETSAWELVLDYLGDYQFPVSPAARHQSQCCTACNP